MNWLSSSTAQKRSQFLGAKGWLRNTAGGAKKVTNAGVGQAAKMNTGCFSHVWMFVNAAVEIEVD
jgi:hypothetical protein